MQNVKTMYSKNWEANDSVKCNELKNLLNQGWPNFLARRPHREVKLVGGPHCSDL